MRTTSCERLASGSVRGRIAMRIHHVRDWLWAASEVVVAMRTMSCEEIGFGQHQRSS
ncbi:hypothetical protein DPMN_118406 [Dreissena polymorpha]|uniref:Uncharacterized protein n=1 Tax=Dreissena polymorpha TaxID=45954 RepID=A0A9D4GK14_DREPO|nr:hypothetical protein DPMN_118406 [Dreissena polymorpha]